MGGLSQSDKIFGALLIAFVVYITVRGQLSGAKGYLGIFQHSAAPASGSSGVVQTVTNTFTQGVQSLLNNANSSFDGIGQAADTAGSVGGFAG